MIKKLLTIAIFVLFIGMSVVSSTKIIIEDINNYNVKDILLRLISSDKKFYAVSYTYPSGSRLVWFDPDDPSTLNDIGPWPNSNFPGGSTFVKDIWWICDTTGNLWKINTETGETEYVGSSGTGELVDLAWDPKADTLWGISTSNLYSIDLDTGSATLTGSINPDILLLNIAADMNGNMWGLGFNSSGFNLYFIDTGTWNATLICNGDISQISEISYEKDEDVMWGISFNYNTFNSELWKIDLDNCTMTLFGNFADDVQISGLAIPYTWTNQKPTAPYVTGPKYGNIGVVYKWTFLSTDPEDDNVTYYVDWGDVCGGAEWHGPYPSGEEVTLAHMYNYQNSFIINTLAIDEHGAESDWTYYEVTIPKNKMLHNLLLLRLLERFPNIFPILQQLLRL